MKKPTQKELILIALTQANDWVKSHDLIKVWVKTGRILPNGKEEKCWLGTSADRQARQMAKDEEIERRINGKYAEYRLRYTRIDSKPVTEDSRVNVPPVQESQQEALLNVKYERE